MDEQIDQHYETFRISLRNYAAVLYYQTVLNEFWDGRLFEDISGFEQRVWMQKAKADMESFQLPYENREQFKEVFFKFQTRGV